MQRRPHRRDEVRARLRQGDAPRGARKKRRAEPILDLKLRLGEGSGGALALPILRLACALHAQMATFDEARISGPAP